MSKMGELHEQLLEELETQTPSQEECEHQDVCEDDFICLDCGVSRREEMMSRAWDRAKSRRQYGE